VKEGEYKSRVYRAVKMGGTLYVCIPRKFAQKHNIKAGDVVVVITNDTMRVVPVVSDVAVGKKV
jgi:antitoxin component of MazEF toxin-antitoxin module